MKTLKPARISLVGLVLLLGFGCAKAPAGFAISQPQANVPDCNVNTTAKKLRIFVMVDNSGSTTATDPDQNYRVQTLRNFIKDYGTRGNLSYGFGYFDDDAYLYDTNQARFIMNSVSVPFGNSTSLSNALAIYHSSISPNGNTGYGAAFKAIQGAITRDESSGVVQDYAVVFMSDGQPTDLPGNIGNALNALVDDLKSAAGANGKSKIALSTVYFGSTSDSTSIRNLRSMATRGSGQFVDTNHLGNGGLSINDVVAIPGCEF